jgi:hypothetical protein
VLAPTAAVGDGRDDCETCWRSKLACECAADVLWGDGLDEEKCEDGPSASFVFLNKLSSDSLELSLRGGVSVTVAVSRAAF